jgi:site-specific DNA-methyltransferase (adenine-specific)
MTLTIEERSIGSITPYDQNPRVNDNAVDAVAKSIQEFSFRVPIVVDGDGVIVCGHTRWKAAQKLGLKTVPVHVAKDLTADQIRALRIADNKTAELATWDLKLLPLELSALQENQFDLSVLGFDPEELEKLLSGDAEMTKGKTDPDVVPEAPEEAVSKRGEIYRLGRHRLLCGDAMNTKGIEELVGDGEVDLLLTDAPYGVGYVGKTSDALTIENDRLDEDGLLNLLLAAFRNANSVMRPGAVFYIWHAESTAFAFRQACKEIGWQIRQALIWVKNSLVLGRQDYHWRHEPCLAGWKEGTHYWCGDRTQTTVLEFNRPSRSAEHPTMKPVDLIERLVLNSSRPKEAVLDLFAGSGTTIIAAEKTGRCAYGCEIDPHYCDVIRKRWSDFVHGENSDWQSLTPVEKTLCATA